MFQQFMTWGEMIAEGKFKVDVGSSLLTITLFLWYTLGTLGLEDVGSD